MRGDVPATLRVLLHRLIDYAGLFPPAGLDMPAAVAHYAAYAASGDAFALGRFVVPVARLDEFASTAADLWSGETWKVSVLAGTDLQSDGRHVSRFNDKHAGALFADAVEVRLDESGAAAEVAYAFEEVPTLYCELSPSRLDRLPEIFEAGCRAKLRTGGVTPEAFPPAAAVASFIATCAADGVPFKATAGLHHPLRSERALTYEPDSVRGVMHGFVNVFLGAAFLHAGHDVSAVSELFAESDAAAIVFGDETVRWRNRELTLVQLAAARSEFAIAFGSCSFDEPLADLRALGWMS